MWNAPRPPADAPALRFAELYAKALDRLGDPRPSQRVGALHTLEVLAQDSPTHRQAIVDVFCALLRSPGTEDGPTRTAVQRILAQHLLPNLGPVYWPMVSLDLTGATLVDLDLTGCRVDGALSLDHATLEGQTKLRGITVTGPFSLRRATFREHAWFERSVFYGVVQADGAAFRADAWFGEAMFATSVRFAGAQFDGHAWFGNCTLRGRLVLDDAVFRRSVGFRGAMLYQGAGLSGTTFLGPARVSRRGDSWNVAAPGWRVVVDADNGSVGQLLWAGNGALIEPTPV